jgi:uncharacterized protein (UPF0210 family)
VETVTLIRGLRLAPIWATLLTFAAVAPAHAQSPTKPNVRAITAFVRLDRATYAKQIAEALTVLRAAKDDFATQGYAVQTIRVVTQPLAELVQGMSEADALAFLKAYDDVSVRESFTPSVGAAMLRDTDDPATMRLLEKVLTTLPNLQANAVVAGEDGIHWKVIHESAVLVRYVADHSAQSQGSFHFTVAAMVKPYGPFYPATYHAGEGRQFSIGLEGASVVQDVFARTHGDFATSVAELTKQLTVHAKVAETIGERVAAATHWTFMGVDPTPAPLGDVSIAAAMETYTGARFGSSGTMTAALVITTAVKAVPVKQVGYAGLMVPVLEDKRLSERWAEGAVGIDALLAYSAVCATGLDTVPVPGDISVSQLERIYGDVASLAWKWNKPLTARLLPVAGKKAGDQTDFQSQYLFNTKLQALP